MNSLILSTATRFLLPLLLLFSVFVLWRGHNEPGGGFVGGLVAAAGFALHAIAHDVTATRRLLVVDPRGLIGGGLIAAVTSGAVALATGKPFMTGAWLYLDLGFGSRLELGTPLLFDAGVYLVVLGVTLTMLFSIAEE
jgi:multicomponent Na+:H+ antiporter subunit B